MLRKYSKISFVEEIQCYNASNIKTKTSFCCRNFFERKSYIAVQAVFQQRFNQTPPCRKTIQQNFTKYRWHGMSLKRNKEIWKTKNWSQPCGNEISIKLIRNFTEITLPYVFLYICYIFAEHIFWRTSIGNCFWICNFMKLAKIILKSVWCIAYLNFPFLLKLFFNNWCNYLIFMYEISKFWEWIAVYSYEKNYSNLFENSSDFGNNMGQLFMKHPVYSK